MSESRPLIDVCLSPALYEFYHRPDAIVVMIDAIRASATMCTAFHYGARRIVPLASTEAALAYKKKDYLTVGERDGLKVEGFDCGNSPYEFMGDHLKNRDVAFTTTNGTRAINTARQYGAQKIVVGGFTNLDALIEWLSQQQQNIVLICTGWKGAVGLEDTVFAGLAASKLMQTGLFAALESVALANSVYQDAKSNYFDYVVNNTPRLSGRMAWLEKDIRYCLTENATPGIVPLLQGDELLLV